MKNIIIIILILIWAFYFFVPHNTQVSLLEKVWIDDTFLLNQDNNIEDEGLFIDFKININWKVKSFIQKSDKKITNMEWWVVKLKFGSDNKIIFEWNISDWNIMTDLTWASWNFVKCFDKNDYDKFSWNLLMHKVLLWKNKKVEVKLTWEGSEKLSIFVYKTDALSKIYPPEKEHTHDCKINVTSELNKKIEMNWNTITSDIVVWIAWPTWVAEWSYTLEIIEK